MRLWHKDLIGYLPRQQLLSQWRECCAISKALASKGTPNHILVNRVLDYPIYHYETYCDLIYNEMKLRGYKVSDNAFCNCFDNISRYRIDNNYPIVVSDIDYARIFYLWHNDRYLRQCLYNLEEKAICGGISRSEWGTIVNEFGGMYDLIDLRF